MKTAIYFLIALVFYSCKDIKTEPISAETSIKNYFKEESKRLLTALDTLKTKSNVEDLKKSFAKSKHHYKNIEPLAEYYFQGHVNRISGPALPDIDVADNLVKPPHGFQVLEELIYAEESPDVLELKNEIDILKTDILFMASNIEVLPLQPHHFHEALQHQMIRIAVLGLTGFDSPVALESLPEAQASLLGVSKLLSIYKSNSDLNLDDKNSAHNFKNAVNYISENNDFNTFNRAYFIKTYLMPLSAELQAVFSAYLKPSYFKNKAFSGTLDDLMQGKKLDPDFFTPYAKGASNPAKIALGKLLFNDVNLSKSKKMSCATCHQSDKGFTDGLTVANINIHSSSQNRNTPTLTYIALQNAFFYDFRASDLENQIEAVMENPTEFGLSAETISDYVSKNEKYSLMLKQAFPDTPEMTPFEIRNSIAAYTRSLMPFTSKIDAFFKNSTELSDSELNGFNLFTGKAKCATCHFMPIYNGTIPPWFNKTEAEVLGVPKRVAWENATISDDLGRYNTHKLEPYQHAFKTPTVRNIDKTAPYFHNGSFSSLEDVMTFYNKGGGFGIGIHLENQTLPTDSLGLSNNEINDVVSFLKALTDM